MNILNLIKKNKFEKFYVKDKIKIKIKFEINKSKTYELNSYNIISIRKNIFIKISKKIENVIVKRNIIMDSPYIVDFKIIKIKNKNLK